MSEVVSAEDAVTLAQRLRARHALWARGNLSWMFQDRPWQLGMYQFVRQGMGINASPYLMLSGHRRSGKSSTGLIVGMEEGIRYDNSAIGVVCKTKDQARAIVEESLVELLKDCPRHVLPRRIKNDFTYLFNNGSKIVILAADKLSPTYARGRKFRFLLVTEGAFIPGLKRLIGAVLAPTLSDVTGKTFGTMLIESSPPDESVSEDDAQEYIAMWRESQLDGRTFYLPLLPTEDHPGNPAADEAFVQKAIRDSGGQDTVTFQREYQCKFILENDATAVPEFTMERAFQGNPAAGVPPLVRAVERPPRADRYFSMDIGGSLDLWGLLWGWYWFEKDALVVEDEALLSNAIGLDIAKEITFHESAIWPGVPGGKLFRCADAQHNSIILADLLRVHGLRIQATLKDHKDAQLNLIRTMVREGRLIVHPRCKLLIKTLRAARRAPTGKRSFARTENIGHADLLDSLLYMARNIHRHEMPEDVRPQRNVIAEIVAPERPMVTSGDRLVGLLKRLRTQQLRRLGR